MKKTILISMFNQCIIEVNWFSVINKSMEVP